MKTVDNYTELLSQIRVTSEALNRASDEATKEIEGLEKRLLDADPGVTAWGPVLVTEELEQVDDEGATQPAQRTVTLGFGRGKKKWGIVVREEVKGKKRARDNDWNLPISDETTLLRKADRELRLLAVPHLFAVVEAVHAELQARAEQLLANGADEPVDAETSEPVTTGSTDAFSVSV